MRSHRPVRAQGYTLIEVLVTFVIVAIGLLGVAQLMVRMHQAQMESYQRAQAVILLQDMASRVAVAGQNASTYLTTAMTPANLGTGDSEPSSCTGAGSAGYDQCIWSNALKGAAETSGSNKVGAMIGARGCIEQIQALNGASGVCQPGIYRVSVVWQGLTATVAPSNLACGQNQYGGSANDAMRRAVSMKVTIGTPAC